MIMTKKELIAALTDLGQTGLSKLKVDELQTLHSSLTAPKKTKEKKVKVPMTEADPKYNMYFIALPKAIRDRVIADKLCPRALYNEYRKRGREHMLSTYASTK
jgi:hypothetical protein